MLVGLRVSEPENRTPLFLDTLLMAERGVSQLVSVDLSTAHQVAEAG